MADDLCKRFKLRYLAIDAEDEGVTEHYGVCYEDGEIRIRLRHARTGRLLKESSLVDTLCHELAHLRHLDHSERFKRLYWKILNKARDLGYYKPGPSESRPLQLDLFAAAECGMRRHAR
jgi:predicted metal-dependent hydrolase